jgi:mgtE-like transporter
MSRRVRPYRALRGILGSDPAAVRQALTALFLNSTTSFVAGGVLGAITETFTSYPGLLVLVPAAIGLRGNIFTAVGNRLSTAIHTGTFRFSARRDTVLGQNVLASIVLTLVLSLVLAVLAKVMAVALGIEGSIGLGDFAVISVAGGLAASVLVLVATVGMAGGAVRFGWDLDNVSAPLVSTLGDVLTLPAIWAATALAGVTLLTPLAAVALALLAVGALVASFRTELDELRRILRESLPVLTVACAVSALAGVAVERRLESFERYPALLVLLPAFLSSAGALGGILSGRLSSRLHLGLVEPASVPSPEAARDIGIVAMLAVPVFLFNAVGAHVVAGLLGFASPGLADMLAVTAVGGVFAVAFVLAVAYEGTVTAFRLGLDPDTYGIPVVTSTIDFSGAFALVLAIAALGIA